MTISPALLALAIWIAIGGVSVGLVFLLITLLRDILGRRLW